MLNDGCSRLPIQRPRGHGDFHFQTEFFTISHNSSSSSRRAGHSQRRFFTSPSELIRPALNTFSISESAIPYKEHGLQTPPHPKIVRIFLIREICHFRLCTLPPGYYGQRVLALSVSVSPNTSVSRARNIMKHAFVPEQLITSSLSFVIFSHWQSH